jgi:hypothetical protein
MSSSSTLNEPANPVPEITNPEDEESFAKWLAEVVPLMDPRSRLAKSLARALARYQMKMRAK